MENEKEVVVAENKKILKIRKENKEIVKSEPADLIKLAIERGANLQDVEKLLALRVQFEENEAKKLYYKKLAIVHKDIPTVAKKLKNPQTNSKYASLDLIVEKTKEVYTAQGFSVCFYEGVTDKPNHVRVCADLIHESGHKNTYFYDVPLDGVGIKGNVNMTAIHGKASSVSYGRRYLMCMIFNIPTGDDNDGNQTPIDFVNEKEYSQMLDHINNEGLTEANVCKFLQVEDFKKLPKSQFNRVMALRKAVKK